MVSRSRYSKYCGRSVPLVAGYGFEQQFSSSSSNKLTSRTLWRSLYGTPQHLTTDIIIFIRRFCPHKAYRVKIAAHPYWGSCPSPQSAHRTTLSRLPRASTMDTNSQRQKRQGNTLSLLNVTIEAMNLAKEVSSATPAKAIFGSVSVLLTMIRVRFPRSSNDLF